MVDAEIYERERLMLVVIAVLLIVIALLIFVIAMLLVRAVGNINVLMTSRIHRNADQFKESQATMAQVTDVLERIDNGVERVRRQGEIRV